MTVLECWNTDFLEANSKFVQLDAVTKFAVPSLGKDWIPLSI